jgi:beta-phosphoglucomutase-like phosphatase (HAD superfamily)
VKYFTGDEAGEQLAEARAAKVDLIGVARGAKATRARPARCEGAVKDWTDFSAHR